MAQTQLPLANKQYDVVSVLYHALQGAETLDRYCSDAEKANDNDLANLFREAQRNYVDVADKAQQLLKQRMQ